jgi:hypothetical protein
LGFVSDHDFAFYPAANDECDFEDLTDPRVDQKELDRYGTT